MRRIAIAGEIFSPNLGDGLIYDCLSGAFARNGCVTAPLDLSGRSGWPDNEQGMDREAHVNLFRRAARVPVRRSLTLRRMISASRWYGGGRRQSMEAWEEVIDWADAVVVGGGQLLTDINFGFPPKIYEVVRMARARNKPVAFFGCGVGKSWGYLATKMYRVAIDYARYVSVRDQVSAENLVKNTRGAAAMHVHPDMAFAVANTYRQRAISCEGNTLGIVLHPPLYFRNFVPTLRDLSNENYRSFWVRLARGACAAGQNVSFITNGDTADYAEASVVVAMLANEGLDVRLKPRAERPEQLVDQFASISTVICTRMHAGIIASGLGKNVIPIALDPKVTGVWDTVGWASKVQAPEFLLSLDPWPEVERLIGEGRDKIIDIKNISERAEAGVMECIRALRS